MSSQHTPGAALNHLFGVEGKVVLVTGGSKGIGRAIAEGFVRAGARTYICARDEEQVTATAAELSAHGECTGLRADLSSVEGCRALADALGERESHLDVLVNNAGTTWHEDLATYAEDRWDQLLDVNLKGPFFLTQALLPLLTAAASADAPSRLVNVGSIRGYLVPQRPSFAYSASKGGLHQVTKHLATVLAPHVTANVLAPGLFESKMSVTTSEATTVHTEIPLGRKGSGDDMAGVALFLASRAGAYVTGQVIGVDGGVGVVAN